MYTIEKFQTNKNKENLLKIFQKKNKQTQHICKGQYHAL